MRRLIWAFARRTYHIVGNLMPGLKYEHAPDERNWKLVFLLLNRNICCGYSKDATVLLSTQITRFNRWIRNIFNFMLNNLANLDLWNKNQNIRIRTAGSKGSLESLNEKVETFVPDKAHFLINHTLWENCYQVKTNGQCRQFWVLTLQSIYSVDI